MSDQKDDCGGCDEAAPCTRCDGDRRNNVWVEGGDPNLGTGLCLLDTLDDARIVFILERDEKARADLLKVTTDPHLIYLAKNVPRLPTVEEADAEQKEVNRHNDPGSIPFYAIFRGQPPFAQ